MGAGAGDGAAVAGEAPVVAAGPDAAAGAEADAAQDVWAFADLDGEAQGDVVPAGQNVLYQGFAGRWGGAVISAGVLVCVSRTTPRPPIGKDE